MTSSACRRSAFVTVLILALSWTAMTAPAQSARAERGQEMQRVVSLLSPDASVSDAEQLLALFARAEAPDLTAAERTAVIAELYRATWRLRGLDAAAGETRISTAAGGSTSFIGFGARLLLETHAPPAGSPPGGIHVIRRGRGAETLVLIGDIGLPADVVYGPFMARNADRYTMYAVTLPGFGDARVSPLPERLDFSQTVWLDAAERAIVDLIARENLRNPILVGTAGGGYFSAAIAARHPERVRAGVVVNGLVRAPMASAADPMKPASLDERRARSAVALPLQFVPGFWPLPSRAEFRELITNPPAGSGLGDPLGSAARDAAMTRDWSVEHLTIEAAWRRAWYAAELGATDLTEELGRLKVPLLVLASLHDFGSPTLGSPVASQWHAQQLRYPDAPLTAATIADRRSYLPVDAPVLFDRAIREFLAGEPVTSTTERTPGALASPHATTSTMIGASKVHVEYYRPGVKGREIWGQLVPYDTLWRTGANGAPMVTFTADVVVEEQRLPAGTYTFLTIPGSETWTIIFNRVPHQFGSFTYDPAFDALRATVTPQEAPMQEWMAIRIEPEGATGGSLTLYWDRLAVPVRFRLVDQ